SARSLSHAQVPAAHAHLPDLPPDAHGADAARALRISDLLDRWHHRSRHHDLDPLAPGADERPDLADSGGGDGYVEPEESVMTVGGQLANWPTGQLAGSRSLFRRKRCGQPRCAERGLDRARWPVGQMAS